MLFKRPLISYKCGKILYCRATSGRLSGCAKGEFENTGIGVLILKDYGYRLLGAAVGFLLGCLALAVLYFLLQLTMEFFDASQVRFRAPVAVFILPIITAFVGLKAGPDVFLLVQNKLGNAGPWTRLILTGPVFWAFVVVAYVLVFEPFGYRISEDEWLLVAKVVLFPTAVLWAGVWVVTKFILDQ